MTNEISEAIRRLALSLSDKESYSRLIDRMGEADFVLLGEASHGTSEFYKIRTELSKRLITEKGFRFIAVEGDWPSCFTLNRYVKGYPDAGSNAREALQDFNRWPSWMWANEEVLHLAEWLREFNLDRPEEEKIGFYGIDVYSLWESMNELVNYFHSKDPNNLQAVKNALKCFEPYGQSEQSYGISASLYGEGCEDEVIELLKRLQDRWKQIEPNQREEKELTLSAELNALAVQGAEAYYRTMIRHDNESWNLRDRHMVNVLEKLIEFHGDGAKCIVWAHNTHVGDARATDMVEEGMVNIGQLLREKYDGHVYAVGLGTYQGSVIAGKEWGAPLEVMTVPPAIPGSWEELLHRMGGDDLLLMFDTHSSWSWPNQKPIGHRAIGVVYHPRWERGNYVPTLIDMRYDAFIYVDRSRALTPLEVEQLFV
ncbi:erythromycin esterase family protein [Paenibacillus sp. H1-7]|uniref:erythromycin esterase family protein n=1 Tax=Paenibacillus sp. H1-7 TaxID=2282849 RepID=UPI001EF8C7E2|nr:erythromycin esterase family protein [Paenibacillus sp. H1-7]ULL14795.1 erythromycin esterase family protein [Paenibacillus sp. H1-7]